MAMAEEKPPAAEARVIVVDNGTRFCRGGWAGDATPTTVFPSIIGTAIHEKVREEGDEKESEEDEIIGEGAFARRDAVYFTSPLKDGVPTNWDALEKIWRYTFSNELQVAPDAHTVFLTEPPLNSKASRERMTQIMFEQFDVSSLFLGCQSVLALHASGCSTGVLLDSGSGITNVVPVVNTYMIPHAVFTLAIAGRTLTEHMMAMLAERGLSFAVNPMLGDPVADIIGPVIAMVDKPGASQKRQSGRWSSIPLSAPRHSMMPSKFQVPRSSILTAQTSITASALAHKRGTILPTSTLPRPSMPAAGVGQRGAFRSGTPAHMVESVAFDIVKTIKEKFAYVALQYDEEARKAKRNCQEMEATHELPGGESITLGLERFRCPEVLFQPILLGKEQKGVSGIHIQVLQAIWACDADLRVELLSNIVLSGGTMLLPGIGERLEHELHGLMPKVQVKVSKLSNCDQAAWVGASMFASEENFRKRCITKVEYEEEGPKIVHAKII